MNPLIRTLIILAIGSGGAYYGFSSYHKLKRADANALGLEQLDQSWLERANWVNVDPDDNQYRDERAGIDKWYFTALTDHYNRFPKFRDYDRWDPAHMHFKGKKASAQSMALRKEYFALVKNVFDQLKQGTYSPQYTGTSNSLRLDILKIGKRTDGKPGFRMDLVLWGAQRRMDVHRNDTGEIIKRMMTSAQFSGMDIRLFDDKKKVTAEMPVTGDPEIKVDYPERWIKEFPPQAVIGYYNLPLLPAKAVQMAISMNITSRSMQGNDIAGTFQWKIPVDPSWKLQPGQTWQGATTEERSKSYIDGKSTN